MINDDNTFLKNYMKVCSYYIDAGTILRIKTLRFILLIAMMMGCYILEDLGIM